VADASTVNTVRYQVAFHFRCHPDNQFSHALHDGPGDFRCCHTEPLVCHDHENFCVTIQDHADRSTACSKITVHCLGQIVYGLLDVLRQRPISAQR